MMKTKFLTFTLITVINSITFAATYSAGHADLGLGAGSELELHLHVHEGSTVNGSVITTPQEYTPPSEATILVPNSTIFSWEANTGWDLIGNNPGDNTWRLPQSESTAESLGAPFLGIGAEDIVSREDGVFVDDELTLKLISVSSDVTGGEFSLYKLQQSMPQFAMASSDGIDSQDCITLLAGGHDHYNFAFSKAGLYEISFEVSAYVDETTLVTDSGTFIFDVVPEPATISLLAFGGVILRRKR